MPAVGGDAGPRPLPLRVATLIFLSFAFACFFSALFALSTATSRGGGPPAARGGARHDGAATATPGYLSVFRHPIFIRFAPMGLFQYGAMVAVQSL